MNKLTLDRLDKWSQIGLITGAIVVIGSAFTDNSYYTIAGCVLGAVSAFHFVLRGIGFWNEK